MSARFNLVFPDDHKQIVAELMEKTGLSTQKDVFENALALFGWAVREVARGNIIASLDEKAKTYGQIHMPALMRVSPASPPKGTMKKQMDAAAEKDQGGEQSPLRERKLA